MQTAAYAQYRAITTETAGPGDLLLQLYQAAIKNVGQGRLAVENANVPAAHTHIVRAQNIVLELQRTLDHEKGGELAATLDSLYTFMRRRLVDANIEKAVEPLDEVQGLLRQLLAAWQIAVRETRR
ncbi:MAG TPA: flagellar export chaperone FliS [Chloroflexota bacterium]|nr:flagellar export chaperone FliS [Chloroflexota bacterium]